MTAGESVARFLDAQVAYMRERRASVENRGVTVITTSGALVTLQLAFLAVAREETLAAPLTLRLTVGTSLLCFLAATAFGILINTPSVWREVDARSFGAHLSAEHWFKDEHLATQAIAVAQLGVLHHYTRVFAVKVRYLRLAFACELAGMTLLAASVFTLLLVL
ncbi:hypothetical protein [Streptomyces sp. NBC_01803]|uniref:hypothetical protein n=1 Tax=Streptomyces sp. NBC_01803 TaxID=2975946 RepID=UPI002DDB0FDD|nr:hypothetical protein [Streptomyces sp. NBC_01803]WSA43379.1 hypothetical protein OIE51_03720 [Streptomyces sp. NBC_01803]